VSFTAPPPRFLLSIICKDTQAEEISNKLSNLKSAENARAKKIRDTEANILRTKAELAPRDVESIEDIEEESVRSLLTIFLKWFTFQWARYSAASPKVAVAYVSASTNSESNSNASLKTNHEPRPR
jgi:hypothetical protein